MNMLTNREYVNSLDDEEFLEATNDCCEMCSFGDDEHCNGACKVGRLDWLRQVHKENIKKCPNCGGEALINRFTNDDNYGYVKCTKCGLKTDVSLISYAVKQWNKRVGDNK